MAHTLNVDERIVLGVERWKYWGGPLEPLHFEPPIFFNPIPQETNGFFDNLYDRLRERWAGGRVRFLGDKNPFYTKRLAELTENFAGARFVVMFRDLAGVANSFQFRADNPRDAWPARNDHRRAVEEWNLALADVRAFCGAGGGDRLFLVDYERFFAGDRDHMEALYRFLDVRLSNQMIRHTSVMRREWRERRTRDFVLSPEAETAVAAARDAELEAWARDRIELQLA